MFHKIHLQNIYVYQHHRHTDNKTQEFENKENSYLVEVITLDLSFRSYTTQDRAGGKASTYFQYEGLGALGDPPATPNLP